LHDEERLAKSKLYCRKSQTGLSATEYVASYAKCVRTMDACAVTELINTLYLCIIIVVATYCACGRANTHTPLIMNKIKGLTHMHVYAAHMTVPDLVDKYIGPAS
jgi:hypothetical protein